MDKIKYNVNRLTGYDVTLYQLKDETIIGITIQYESGCAEDAEYFNVTNMLEDDRMALIEYGSAASDAVVSRTEARAAERNGILVGHSIIDTKGDDSICIWDKTIPIVDAVFRRLW